jgi:RNA polymerase sigma-70 factor (ECF subfamily)
VTANALRDELIEQMAPLRRYALALTRNPMEAEDLVQECLLKAMTSADQWKPGTDLRAWLFRILYTLHISTLRKKQVRDRVHAEGMLPPDREDPNQQVRLEARQVLAALDILPPPQREAILAVVVEDLRYEEAAQRLDIPLGTFMSRLSRGREALRQFVEGRKRPKLKIVRSGRHD